MALCKRWLTLVTLVTLWHTMEFVGLRGGRLSYVLGTYLRAIADHVSPVEAQRPRPLAQVRRGSSSSRRRRFFRSEMRARSLCEIIT